MKNSVFILIVLISFTIISCGDKDNFIETQLSPNLPNDNYDYKSTAINQRGFPNSNVIEVFNNQSFNNFENPVVTDEGATLGRVLFYDNNLSLNRVSSDVS